MMQLRSRRSPHVILQAVRSRTNGCDRLSGAGPGSRRVRKHVADCHSHVICPSSSPRRRLPPRLALLLPLFLLGSPSRHVTAAGRGPEEKRGSGKRRRGEMISQFFVLSQRGDHIVFRDCKIWIPSRPRPIWAGKFLLFVVIRC